MPTTDWTYEDFLTYLLIMGAKADLEMSDEQREAIIKQMGTDEFLKVEKVFNKQNDAQHIETVMELYNRYSDQIGGKENLIKALENIFKASGSQDNPMDRELVMMLKRIL